MFSDLYFISLVSLIESQSKVAPELN